MRAGTDTTLTLRWTTAPLMLEDYAAQAARFDLAAIEQNVR